MSKHLDKIKNQLTELSIVVNAFKSEAVQVRVIDRLLQLMTESGNGSESFNNGKGQLHLDDQRTLARRTKRLGATKMLNQLLLTDFFTESRSLSSIVEHCNEEFDTNVKTSEFSGVLLRFVKDNRLKRKRSDDGNYFNYIRA